MRQVKAAKEMKFCALDLKRVQEDGAFAGYASLFDRVDLGRDVVSRGAFRDSLAKRGAGGIKLLFQHDPNQVIGVWDEIREDARGLFVRGRLLPDVAIFFAASGDGSRDDGGQTDGGEEDGGDGSDRGGITNSDP